MDLAFHEGATMYVDETTQRASSMSIPFIECKTKKKVKGKQGNIPVYEVASVVTQNKGNSGHDFQDLNVRKMKRMSSKKGTKFNLDIDMASTASGDSGVSSRRGRRRNANTLADAGEASHMPVPRKKLTPESSSSKLKLPEARLSSAPAREMEDIAKTVIEKLQTQKHKPEHRPTQTLRHDSLSSFASAGGDINDFDFTGDLGMVLDKLEELKHSYLRYCNDLKFSSKIKYLESLGSGQMNGSHSSKRSSVRSRSADSRRYIGSRRGRSNESRRNNNTGGS
mmetsp:Transcript_36191/g.45121  ORF Transcript_36191/g.45121 Transcript_36191/m.45121 type:complete len:281 (-) Transcript_36191:112-954(-)